MTTTTTTATAPAAAPPGGEYRAVQVHFDDLDAMGMLHNARYQVLVERALIAFWAEHGWHRDPERAELPDGLFAVREASVSYHAPITEVCAPVVHFWVESVGRTSVVYRFRVLSQDRATVHATGRRAQVLLGRDSLRPEPISEPARAVLAELTP